MGGGEVSALLHDEMIAALEREELPKRLIVSPILDPIKQIGPGSIDLRLGTEFLEIDRSRQHLIDPMATSFSDPSAATERRSYVPLGQGLVLHPNQFLLGSTLEFIGLPDDLVGQVLSRSSWGRIGLLVATAVSVHPGFRGVLTLELVNAGNVPIFLRPGSRVAQLQLWKSNGGSGLAYGKGNKYVTPIGPEATQLDVEYDEADRLARIYEAMRGSDGS